MSSNESTTTIPESSTEFSTSVGTTSPDNSSNQYPESQCKMILFATINHSNVRIWDLCMLIPSIIFTVFLLINCRKAIPKLRSSSNPVVVAFYVIVWLVDVIKIVRALVSMTVSAAVAAGFIVDKTLWLCLQFLLLSTEFSVLVFGLGSEHLETGRSVRRVVVASIIIALIYAVIESTLEFEVKDPMFYVDGNTHLYSHGGSVFFLVSSIVCFTVYVIISLMAYTSYRDRLPNKRSFFIYIWIMATLYFVQCLGSFLLSIQVIQGFCFINFTSFLYFTAFDPLVYAIFLKGYFTRPKGLFSFLYQPHYDMAESMPGIASDIGPAYSQNVDLSTPDQWQDPHEDYPAGTLDFDYDYFSGQVTSTPHVYNRDYQEAGAGDNPYRI